MTEARGRLCRGRALRGAAFFARPLRYGITKPGAPLGGGFLGYGLYKTRDGWIAVAALEQHFWAWLLLEPGLEGATREDLDEAFVQKTAKIGNNGQRSVTCRWRRSATYPRERRRLK